MANYQYNRTGSEVAAALDAVINKTVYGEATQEERGLMSAADKRKLDGAATLDEAGRLDSGQAVRVLLASMGEELDNAGVASASPVKYTPKAGDAYWDGTDIVQVKTDGTEARNAPSRDLIYTNNATDRMYKWTGRVWDEVGAAAEALGEAEIDAICV